MLELAKEMGIELKYVWSYSLGRLRKLLRCFMVKEL